MTNISIEYIANWFGIEPEDDGTFDTRSYNWTAGCYLGDRWLCLNEVVDLVEHVLNDNGVC